MSRDVRQTTCSNVHKRARGKRDTRRRLRYQSHLGTLLWNGTKLRCYLLYSPSLCLSYVHGLLLPRVKAARFLGCIYISLLLTSRFDKQPAHERECRVCKQKQEHTRAWNSNRESKRQDKTGLSGLMESSMARKFSYGALNGKLLAHALRFSKPIVALLALTKLRISLLHVLLSEMHFFRVPESKNVNLGC